MNKKQAKLLILFSFIFVAIIGVVFYIRNRQTFVEESKMVQSQESPVVDVGVVYEENKPFLELFSFVTSIVIDTSLFEEAVFKGLQDNSVTIQKEPIGRKNPFLPIFSVITKGTKSTSGQAPIIDDSALTVGEKVAIGVVTKVVDFIDKNNGTRLANHSSLLLIRSSYHASCYTEIHIL